MESFFGEQVFRARSSASGLIPAIEDLDLAKAV
jgi:hypothetical protein